MVVKVRMIVVMIVRAKKRSEFYKCYRYTCYKFVRGEDNFDNIYLNIKD